MSFRNPVKRRRMTKLKWALFALALFVLGLGVIPKDMAPVDTSPYRWLCVGVIAALLIVAAAGVVAQKLRDKKAAAGRSLAHSTFDLG